MDQCHEKHSKFTVVVLQSGGLLCTHSAIRSGWTPIWGTEICPTHTNAPMMCQAIERLKCCDQNSQQRMWKYLTRTPCYGNTFANITQYSKLEHPIYLKVSPECTFYCVGGDQTGSMSLSGWQLPDIALIGTDISPSQGTKFFINEHVECMHIYMLASSTHLILILHIYLISV